MTTEASPGTPAQDAPSARLGLLLASAMFVLVVDTSLMNVSISAVVEDLDTTVSGVQSAVALEALVSAAFILISSKVADLIGRKRAYTLGLLAYATGALAMTLAQSLWPVVLFWAILGGLGASLLLPAMQSLIHGNFDGAARKKTYALVGAAAAIAAMLWATVIASAPSAYASRPRTYARLRPNRSPTLLLIRMKAAETRASSAIALWTALTVVSRSLTTAEIETFISDVSTTSTNIAAPRSSDRRRLPASSGAAIVASSVMGHD